MDVSRYLTVLCLLIKLHIINSTLCPCGYSAYKGSCYMIFGQDINDRKRWSDARLECQMRGGDLASVTDQEEQDFIWNMRGTISGIWIGLCREEVTSGDVAARRAEWRWTDGSQYSWMNWHDDGDINSDPQAGEDAARIEANTDGSAIWKGKVGTTASYAYACKRQPFYGSNTVCSSERCYTFVEKGKTWSEAKEYCQSINQQLLSLTSGTVLNITDDIESVVVDTICNEKIYWVQSELEGQVCSFLKKAANDERWSLGIDACSGDSYQFICTREPLCLSGWNENDGYCYKVINKIKAQLVAQGICEEYDSDLLAIESPSEAHFIQSLYPGEGFWLRYIQDDDSKWTLSDGTPTDFPRNYSSWAHGSPYNFDRCALVYQRQWHSKACNRFYAFICEQKTQGQAILPTAAGPSPTTSETTLDTLNSHTTTSENITDDNGNESPNGLPVAVIAALVILSVLLFIAICIAVVFALKYHNMNNKNETDTIEDDNEVGNTRAIGIDQSENHVYAEPQDSTYFNVEDLNSQGQRNQGQYQSVEGAPVAYQNANIKVYEQLHY